MLAINSLGDADISQAERDQLKRVARQEVEAFLESNGELIATSTVDGARSLLTSMIQGESDSDSDTVERLRQASEEEALRAMQEATEEAAAILQDIANRRALAAQTYSALTTLGKAAINAGLSAAIGFAPFSLGG
jgi:hypothetical protein